LLLTDTAGVHDDSQDVIERIGIERAQSAFASADMILWLGPEGGGPPHPVLIEIDAKADDRTRTMKSTAALLVSAQSGHGMLALVDQIISRAKTLLPGEDSFALNARQRGFLRDARDALSAASTADDWLIVGEHLRLARLALDALSGRAHTEDMLDTLFGRFCVGK
jgi:tRNA modification GTPase